MTGYISKCIIITLLINRFITLISCESFKLIFFNFSQNKICNDGFLRNALQNLNKILSDIGEHAKNKVVKRRISRFFSNKKITSSTVNTSLFRLSNFELLFAKVDVYEIKKLFKNFLIKKYFQKPYEVKGGRYAGRSKGIL